MLHYHQKNMLNPLVKSVLNPFTITGDICNFVTAVSALSNRSLGSVYNYAHRPILHTGLRPVQLFLVIIITNSNNKADTMVCRIWKDKHIESGY